MTESRTEKSNSAPPPFLEFGSRPPLFEISGSAPAAFQHEESKFRSQGTSHSSSYGILEPPPPEHYTKLLQSKYRKQYSFYFGFRIASLKVEASW